MLELLLVLSITGVLLTFALPQYGDHLMRARRLAAKTALMDLAGRLEVYFVEHQSYQDVSFENLQVPEFVANQHYRLVIQEATESRFTLAALPQAGEDRRCGSLLLYSSGEKGVSGVGGVRECW